MQFELIEHDKDDAYDPAPFLSYARLRSQERAERDPVLGDIVHYWDGEGCSAALMIRDDLDSICLTVFRPEADGGPAELGFIAHSEAKLHDTWHWPCGGR